MLLAVPVDWNDYTQGFQWDGNATRGEEMFSATIKFVHGDAANHNDMKEIMAKQTYDVAVVLGTQVMGATCNWTLFEWCWFRSRLSRCQLSCRTVGCSLFVVSVRSSCSIQCLTRRCTVLLRHLSPTDSKMRVVSENSDDQTALLAVAPKSNQQDFINTQVCRSK